MCLYTGIQYPTCPHLHFELYLFCPALLTELNRINDPVERDTFALPFDPDLPGCQPLVAMSHYCLRVAGDGGPVGYFPAYDYGYGYGYGYESNVVRWVVCLEEECPECWSRSC